MKTMVMTTGTQSALALVYERLFKRNLEDFYVFHEQMIRARRQFAIQVALGNAAIDLGMRAYLKSQPQLNRVEFRRYICR